MKLMRFLGVTIIAMVCFVAVAVAARAKDARTIVLHTDAVVAGSHLASGKYDVQWQTHSPEATVSFLKESKVVATVTGKVVDRGKKYASNEVLFDNDGTGGNVVQELRFKDSSQVIVFNE